MNSKKNIPDETAELCEGVPPAILEALRGHALHGRPTGAFVRAVLDNDLCEAVCQADPASLAALRAIVQYVYNALPGRCWSSRAAVDAWSREKGGANA